MADATSGSPQFDAWRAAFEADPALRQEAEWAFRLAVETYNPSDRGLRFITGGIGEWIVALTAYRAGIVALPEGHNADGHDITDLLTQSRALWSVKTSYQSFTTSGTFTITNGQGGPGSGFTVPTVFLAPGLPGIVYVSPASHPTVAGMLVTTGSETKLRKRDILNHAIAAPACVIPFTMPENPGAAIRDPGLEAVRLLVDGPQFPRLREMFLDLAARHDTSLVSQLRDLRQMRDAGDLTEAQFQAAVTTLTGSR